MNATTNDHHAASGRSRREFLRTIGTAGYAVGVAQLLGVDDGLGADGEVSVVTALARTDPADPWTLAERTRTVPADWHAAVTTAFDLNDRLARTRVPGYLGSAVVPGDYRDPGATISVGIAAAEFDRALPALETLLEGVAFDAEAIEQVTNEPDERTEPSLRFAERIGEDGVPGGVGCLTVAERTTGMATLTPALYEPTTGQALFATASHAFRGADADGCTLHLPLDDGEQFRLGYVHDDHPTADVVTVASQGGIRPASVIAGPERVRVRGQFTRLGLADLAARGKPLEKVGARTGRTTGTIEGIDAVTCLTGASCRHGQLRWGDRAAMADGDSGSVSYRPDPDGEDGDVFVAGFNNARAWWPGQNYVWGTAAYHLTAHHGYHF